MCSNGCIGERAGRKDVDADAADVLCKFTLPQARVEVSMKALHITSQTLLGVGRQERPQQHGNCFSVKVEGEQYERRISNFNLENLEALVKNGLTWPIEVEPLGERNALVMDARIGERWYDQRYCEICTPRTLLPSNQVAAHQRRILRCEITEHLIESGPLKGHTIQSGMIPPRSAEFP